MDNSLNLNNYISRDKNPVYEGGIGNYQEPPRKLVLTNLDSSMNLINIGEYLDNAGFELFIDSKLPLSRQSKLIKIRLLEYQSSYPDKSKRDYRMEFIIPDDKYGGFPGFGSKLHLNLIDS